MSVPNAETLWLRAFKPMLDEADRTTDENKNFSSFVGDMIELMKASADDMKLRRGPNAEENILLLTAKARNCLNSGNISNALTQLRAAWSLVYDGSISLKGAAEREAL